MKRLGLCLLLLLSTCAGFGSPGDKKGPCKDILSDCPRRGCADLGTPDALSNTAKHNLSPKGPLRTLTFEDFASLQEQVENKFNGKYHTLSKPDRLRLRNMEIGGEQIGERRLVEIVAYIAVLPAKSKPHANDSGESVNCRLPDGENNDFHISLTPGPGQSEYQGIVVEMIPQRRNPKWTEDLLKTVQGKHLMVRVRGQLFFDNHHYVNRDETKPKNNQPKRMSLWEIHPVTQFDVCTAQLCTATGSGWTPLADWK